MSSVLEEFPHITSAEPGALLDRLDILRKQLDPKLKPDTMPEEEELKLLREMSVIAGTLRRRTAGPPKAAKAAKGTKRTHKTVDDIL